MDQLFLISYRGTIATLALSKESSSKYSLQETPTTRACEPNPSWLSLDAERRTLYCTEGGMTTGTGALKAFRIEPDGTLTETSSVPTPKGAAHHILCNNGNTLIVAFYYAGYIGIYDVGDVSQIKTIQEITFELAAPGPGKDQTQSRPHQIAVDPSGLFMLSPDLGADMLRVFDISRRDRLREIEGPSLPKGSYPRHVALVEVQSGIKLYILLQELNTLLDYNLAYGKDGTLEFSKVSEVALVTSPEGIPIVHSETRYLKASHITPSPDGKFLLVSLRGDSTHTIASPLNPQTKIPSDSHLTYSIHPVTGALSLVDNAATGGSIPRQFSMNAKGDKVAIVSQRNG